MTLSNPVITWLVIAIIFFIIEIVTPTVFFFACFGIGAIVAALVFHFTALAWLTWIVFAIVSVIGIIVSRPLADKFSGKSARLANVDALIGQKGKVIKTIDPEQNEGMVVVAREQWRAEAAEKIEIGETIEVIKVEGTHLLVKKIGS